MRGEAYRGGADTADGADLAGLARWTTCGRPQLRRRDAGSALFVIAAASSPPCRRCVRCSTTTAIPTTLLRVGQGASRPGASSSEDFPDPVLVPDYGHDGQQFYVLAATFPDLRSRRRARGPPPLPRPADPARRRSSPRSPEVPRRSGGCSRSTLAAVGAAAWPRSPSWRGRLGTSAWLGLSVAIDPGARRERERAAWATRRRSPSLSGACRVATTTWLAARPVPPGRLVAGRPHSWRRSPACSWRRDRQWEPAWPDRPVRRLRGVDSVASSLVAPERRRRAAGTNVLGDASTELRPGRSAGGSPWAGRDAVAARARAGRRSSLCGRMGAAAPPTRR